MEIIQRPIGAPSVEIVVNGAARRKVLGDVAPLAARPEDIHEAIHDLTDVDRTLVATRFGGWDQRFDLGPLFGCQVVSVAQTTTVVSETGLICPHGAPRESVLPIESHMIRAGQAPGLTDSKDSNCSRTGTKGLRRVRFRQ